MRFPPRAGAAGSREPGHRHGELIQEYVRAKWSTTASRDALEGAGRQLPPELRTRIDLLGLDDRHLLDIPAGAVLPAVERLERDGETEDRPGAPPDRRDRTPPRYRRRGR